MRCGAKLSPCGKYRYALWRDWRDGDEEFDKGVLFIMLNPSTADAEHDDPTIRKCMGFARNMSRGAIVVLNLFAWRATDPKDLRIAQSAGENIVGADNRYWHRSYLNLHHVHGWPVIAAWGAHPIAAVGVDELGDLWPDRLMSLGVTKEGHPRHPLYVPYANPLVPWRAAA